VTLENDLHRAAGGTVQDFSSTKKPPIAAAGHREMS
jgi:hypothetical protein